MESKDGRNRGTHFPGLWTGMDRSFIADASIVCGDGGCGTWLLISFVRHLQAWHSVADRLQCPAIAGRQLDTAAWLNLHYDE